MTLCSPEGRSLTCPADWPGVSSVFHLRVRGRGFKPRADELGSPCPWEGPTPFSFPGTTISLWGNHMGAREILRGCREAKRWHWFFQNCLNTHVIAVFLNWLSLESYSQCRHKVFFFLLKYNNASTLQYTDDVSWNCTLEPYRILCNDVILMCLMRFLKRVMNQTYVFENIKKFSLCLIIKHILSVDKD